MMKCDKCHTPIDETKAVSISTLRDINDVASKLPSDSFDMLTESAADLKGHLERGQSESNTGKKSLLPKMLRAQKINALLQTDGTTLKYQCRECNDKLLEATRTELQNLQRECTRLIAFEKDYERRKDDVSIESLRKDISKLKKAESAAKNRILDLDKEHQALEAERRKLDIEEAQLDAEEAYYLRQYTLVSNLEKKKSLSSLEFIETESIQGLQTLARLQNTNVYNDAFSISQDGIIGTINSLRLGRLPNHPVDWPEINAAWGEVALLLFTVAKKLQVQFDNYEIVPMGSYSKMVKTGPDGSGTYELYGSGDFVLGRILHNHRFDLAMVAYLDCLQQVMHHLESTDPSVDFPYKVNKDKIGDVSIKFQLAADESWTRALRFLLVDLKYLIARI